MNFLSGEFGLQLDQALGAGRVDKQLVARVSVAEQEPVGKVLITLKLVVSCVGG